MGTSGKVGWEVKGHTRQAGSCRLQSASKAKACQEWSSKEDWETQKESSEERAGEAGAGRGRNEAVILRHQGLWGKSGSRN